MTPFEIYAEAQDAAVAAAHAEDAKLGPENIRGLDCGFAWVVIKPARGAFVNYLKSIDVGSTRDYGGGGYSVWGSRLHDLQTQSISVHYAAAKAFAAVLVKHGLNAYADQRLD